MLHLVPVLALAALASLFPRSVATDPTPSSAITAPAVAVGFVENRGQWRGEVKYWARGRAAEVTVLADRLVFSGVEGVMSLVWPQDAALEADELRAGVTSFYAPAGSASGARSWGVVRCGSVADGVDVVVRPDGDSFAYDLELAASADLAALVLCIDGAREASIGEDGALRLTLDGGIVEQRIGACWQVDADSGERRRLRANYRLVASKDGALRFGFDVPDRSPDQALVIDPTLVYGTYLGTPASESPVDIAVDAQGCAYVVAKTTPAMPVTPDAFQPSATPPVALWVGKLSAAGSHLEWATFLDGSDVELAEAVAVDASGSIVVVGQTWSTDFPTSPGGHKSEHNGTPTTCDVFVVRLDAASGMFTHGTFFGGDYSETVDALALGSDGSAIVALTPVSTAPPHALHATSGAFDTVKDPPDRMIARFSADLSELVFATWFPIARFTALATDADGNVYFAGDSNSSTGPVPTTPGAFQPQAKSTKDCVVGKLHPTGAELLWCTYVGGSVSDTPWGMTVDAARAVYIVGQTTSNASDFPTTPGAFSAVPTPSGVAFASKILADGSGLAWSTYIGGSGGGGGFLAAALVDAAGNLTGVGYQNQPGWPTTPDAFMPTYVGSFPNGDFVITKFDAVGSSLMYSTFLGGSSTDYQPHAAMDPSGRPFLVGYTGSPDFPTTPGVFQPAFNQGAFTSDMAVAAFDLGLAPWRLADTATRSGPRIPNLVGMGSLEPGTEARLSFRGGVPSGFAWLVVGLAEWSIPVAEYDAVFYPSLDFLIPVPIDAAGGFDLTFPAPDVPLDLFFQAVGFDPALPQLLYASNGVRTQH